TYLALLGLESAARSGAQVPAKVFLTASALLVGWQAPKGRPVTVKMNEIRGADRFEWTETAKARGFGWSGCLSDTPSGYETAAGAAGLVVCQDALQGDRAFTSVLRQQARVAIRDAIAWVQQNYDITKNPVLGKASNAKDKEAKELEGSLYHHHWLQSLARLAIHARMRFIGTHDWYQEGAEALMKT